MKDDIFGAGHTHKKIADDVVVWNLSWQTLLLSKQPGAKRSKINIYSDFSSSPKSTRYCSFDLHVQVNVCESKKKKNHTSV